MFKTSLKTPLGNQQLFIRVVFPSTYPREHLGEDEKQKQLIFCVSSNEVKVIRFSSNNIRIVKSSTACKSNASFSFCDSVGRY